MSAGRVRENRMHLVGVRLHLTGAAGDPDMTNPPR